MAFSFLRLFGFAFLSVIMTGSFSYAGNNSVYEAEQRLAGYARVIDGDTVEVKGERIRLHGIDAPESAQRCQNKSHKNWRCGRSATRRLRDMIKGQKVSCNLNKKDRYKRWIGVCFLGSRNLNKAMVQQGLAWAFVKYSADFVAEEKEAADKGLGVWAAKNDPAWVYRSKRWKQAKQLSPSGCVIKGNISKRSRRRSQKIYHLPGFRSYGKTRINVKKGERWFCSEREAQLAGWRKAYK